MDARTVWRGVARGLCVALLAVFAAAGGIAQSVLDVPPLHAHVTDIAGALVPERHEQLESRLAQIERDTQAQIAVLIVASTRGEPIESFAVRVWDAWKLGAVGRDDGVLVVLARDDRAARIATGYGLEGDMPDALAARILREYATPFFAAGDYAGGLDAVVDALDRTIRGQPLPASRPPSPAPALDRSDVPPVLTGDSPRTESRARVSDAVVAGAIVGAFALFIAGFVSGRRALTVLDSRMLALSAWLLGLLLWWGVLFAEPSWRSHGFVQFLIGAFSLGALLGIVVLRGGEGDAGGGGGRSDSGGSGGSSGSGSGWSGGGGSTGGGGASGHW